MKRLLMAMAAVAVGTLVWSSAAASAQAAGIDAADVAAGAKWLVHINFDAARDSKLGEHFRTHALASEHAKEALAKLHDDFGFDPEKDLHGATLYGTDFTQHSGVLIIYATADKDKVVSYLRSKPDFATSKSDDGVDLYTWSANVGKEKKQTAWAAMPKPGVAVVAENADSLKAALAVIAGKGGLSSSSPLLGDAPKGTILRAAVVGLAGANLPIQHPLAKQIDDVHLAIGESDGDDFIKLKVDATQADAAKQMKALIDGITGMIGLQAGDHPEAQQLLKNLKVEQEDKVLTVDWKAPADELIKLGEKMQSGAGQRFRSRNPDRSGRPGNSDDK